MIGGSRVRYNDSFVVGGGQVYECDNECEEGEFVFGDKSSNALYQYLPDNGTFLELPGKMKYGGCPCGDPEPECGNIAIVVERSIFPACPSTTTTTTPATDNGASSMSSLLAAITLLLAAIFFLH